MIVEIIDYTNNIIDPLIPYLSILLAGGIVLYFDGLLFSGGKGWVKGFKNTFETLNKGFKYFLLNIFAMLVAGYVLQLIIQNILFTYKRFFIPLISQFLLLIYVYYLKTYSKKGALRWSVIVLELLVVAIFYVFR
ncbi:MAG: hypothetical protein V1921_03740 [Candidatus Altiarchaeota archaeon]